MLFGGPALLSAATRLLEPLTTPEFVVALFDVAEDGVVVVNASFSFIDAGT